MLRVLRVSENDPILRSNNLKNHEVDSLIEKYEERKKKRSQISKRSFNRSTENLSQIMDKSSSFSSSFSSRPQSMPDIHGSLINCEDDEDYCPVCLYPTSSHEKLVVCKRCKHDVHQKCFDVWQKTREEENDPVYCPVCRANWSEGFTKSLKDRFTSMSSIKTSNLSHISSILSLSLDENRKQKDQNLALDSYSPSTFYIGSHPNKKATNINQLSHQSSLEYQEIITRGKQGKKIVKPHQLQNQEKFESWKEIFDPELIQNLMSTDWTAREKGLEQLYVEIATILACGGSEESTMTYVQPKSLNIILSCCWDILAVMATDPVYKVYIACLRCFLGLLGYIVCKNEDERSKLQANVKSIVNIILLKCADGNRRVSQLSIASLVQLCKGSRGKFAIGRRTRHQDQNDCLGVPFVLNCILENDAENGHGNWLSYLGRLYLLDRLMVQFPEDFYLLFIQMHSKGIHYCHDGCGCKFIHLDRLRLISKYAVKLLNHKHLTVRKMSKKVFTTAARFTSHIPAIFLEICSLLDSIDSTLEAKIKDRISNSVRLGQLSSSTSSGLLEQVQNSTGNDETIVYTSVRNFKDCDSDLSRSLHTEDAILDKLVTDFPGDSICNPYASWKSPRRSHHSMPHSASHSVKYHCDKKDSFHTGKGENSIKRPMYLPLKEKQKSSYDCLDNRSDHFSKPEYSGSKNSLLSSEITQFGQNNEKFCCCQKKHSCCARAQLPRKQYKSGRTPKAPPNTPSNCPVGDLIDLSCSPPIMTSTPREPSAASNEMYGVNPMTPKQSKICGIKEATLLVKAMEEQLSIQPSLPIIPGLTNMSFDSFDNAEFAVGLNLTEEDNSVSETENYTEGTFWVRGQLLGTGAFSSCYQARDVKTGTIMAVKQVSFCRNSVEEQDHQKEAIRDEIIMMSKLNHPNIVRLIGANLQDNHYNMFVEWMPGGSVSTLLRHYGPFNKTVILRYVKQVLSGLACLHRNHILHRDLKGANLLVDSTGHHLRIGDFGAAARLASQRTLRDEFKGQLLGTIAFMAPEVLRGEGYGRSCDVWSVGCVVIEMATTKPPWDAADISNDLALLYKIACSHSPPPIPSSLSPAISAMALRCLAPNSKDRPPAKELLKDACFNSDV